MKRFFKIANYCFSADWPEDLPVPENFLKFEEKEENTAERHYEICTAEQTAAPEGKPLYTRPGLSVWNDADGFETRLLSIPGEQTPYGLTVEHGDRTKIRIPFSAYEDLVYDNVFTSLFSPEKYLLERNCLILHSCYTDIKKDGAILFTGPSGCGKSTQGDLWVKHRGAEVVNGDRSVIDFSGGRIRICGFPVCGSSGICNNRNMPLTAVFLPVKAQENRAERVSLRDAFSQLYGQFTLNGWKRDRILAAMPLIERFVAEVPVYRLYCTISEEAVKAAEEVLN